MILTFLLLGILSLYLLVNLGRVAKERVHPDYLARASRKTSLWLIGLQILVIGSYILAVRNDVNILTCFYILAVCQLAAAVVLLLSTLRSLRTTRPPELTEHYATRDLPALTVAIPARNETEELEACLQSLIKSTYPKLEILVLDDCSQERRTPEIIRQFAQDGVRFMAGKEPPERWLAKNYAYDQLADEANGVGILFCGVDCRFEPDSLEKIVKTMLQKRKTMASIMPRNLLPSRSGIRSLLVQPSRYAWELALPRRLLNRPPVLSTCWIITKEALQQAGGFDAVHRKIVPESYFAKQTAAKDDGYSFIVADEALGVTSEKDFESQRQTAIRVRYPQLHRRPELVALVSLAELAILIWPPILMISALLQASWLLGLLSGAAFAITSTVYVLIMKLTYRRFLWRGITLLPFAAIYDLILLNYSMWQYEFGEVLWKGRNICLPVMRAIPALPKLK